MSYEIISPPGGASLFLDAACGHLWMARENIARALAVKDKGEVYTMEMGKDLPK
ncbi:hypothetical protein HMPREF0240_03846 [Clostridium sp. D5]|nr:hypothetical protein HMPREF0240_03846 [Clostridium sp. D5]